MDNWRGFERSAKNVNPVIAWARDLERLEADVLVRRVEASAVIRKRAYDPDLLILA